MFRFCPSCGGKNIVFKINKFECPDCHFVYYHNTAAATGCVIESNGEVLFLERAKEPCTGKLDLPGGFVDPGEGLFEGLCRELREEIGWEAPVKSDKYTQFFTLFASFPNVYPYKNISYNTCDAYFYFSAPAGLSEKDFTFERKEIKSIKFIKPENLAIDELAFESTKKAIKRYIEIKKGAK